MGGWEVSLPTNFAKVLRNMAESSAIAIFNHESSTGGDTMTAALLGVSGSTAATSGSSSLAQTPSSSNKSFTVPPRALAAAAAMGNPSPEESSAACSWAHMPSVSAMSFNAPSPRSRSCSCSQPGQLRNSNESLTLIALSSSGSTFKESVGGLRGSPYLKALESKMSRMMLNNTLSNKNTLRCLAFPVVSARPKGLLATTKRVHLTSISCRGSISSHLGSYRPAERRISTALQFKTSVISSS
mmetsp:Transcript_32053/g.110795  ORF Transcript_32053/g.110795 Transcript_32053/m.110795 type:complete len:242 (+) Transcript_32053:605-1330(+)